MCFSYSFTLNIRNYFLLNIELIISQTFVMGWHICWFLCILYQVLIFSFFRCSINIYSFIIDLQTCSFFNFLRSILVVNKSYFNADTVLHFLSFVTLKLWFYLYNLIEMVNQAQLLSMCIHEYVVEFLRRCTLILKIFHPELWMSHWTSWQRAPCGTLEYLCQLVLTLQELPNRFWSSCPNIITAHAMWVVHVWKN